MCSCTDRHGDVYTWIVLVIILHGQDRVPDANGNRDRHRRERKAARCDLEQITPRQTAEARWPRPGSVRPTVLVLAGRPAISSRRQMKSPSSRTTGLTALPLLIWTAVYVWPPRRECRALSCAIGFNSVLAASVPGNVAHWDGVPSLAGLQKPGFAWCLTQRPSSRSQGMVHRTAWSR